MILKAFSLLDIKAGVFSQPFFMAHAGQAIRAVMDLAQDLNTTVGRHPADFQLCELGTFDDVTGVLSAVPPIPFGTVAQLAGPPKPPVSLFPTTPPNIEPVPEVRALNGHAQEGA